VEGEFWQAERATSELSVKAKNVFFIFL